MVNFMKIFLRRIRSISELSGEQKFGGKNEQEAYPRCCNQFNKKGQKTAERQPLQKEQIAVMKQSEN
jgi:hypothetical protein